MGVRLQFEYLAISEDKLHNVGNYLKTYPVYLFGGKV